MKIDRSTVFVLIAAFAVGYFAAGNADRSPSPRPSDRPVLSWIARAAKNLLWVAILADPPPPEQADTRVVHHAVGADGYPLVDHGRGL